MTRVCINQMNVGEQKLIKHFLYIQNSFFPFSFLFFSNKTSREITDLLQKYAGTKGLNELEYAKLNLFYTLKHENTEIKFKFCYK